MDAESALALLRHHGPLALVLVMALNRLGLVPGGVLILVAAGALARQGALPLAVALATAYLGTTLGDSALYGAGRFGLGWLSRPRERREIWERAHAALERWAGPAVFLTRWLILPLTIAVSLLCGVDRYSYRRFALAGAAGNLIFVLLFVGVGFRFGAGWQPALGAGALRASLVAAAAVLLGLLVAGRLRQRLAGPRDG